MLERDFPAFFLWSLDLIFSPKSERWLPRDRIVSQGWRFVTLLYDGMLFDVEWGDTSLRKIRPRQDEALAMINNLNII